MREALAPHWTTLDLAVALAHVVRPVTELDLVLQILPVCPSQPPEQ